MARRPSLSRAIAFVPAGFALLLPFLGPLLAWLSPWLARARRDRLWPRSSRRTTMLAAIAVPVGILVSLILFPYAAFLLIPLCAPSNILGWLLPSAIAIVAYAVGCVASLRRGSPWLWPIGAVAAVAAFSVSSLALVAAGVEYVC